MLSTGSSQRNGSKLQGSELLATEGDQGGNLPGLLERFRISVSQMAVGRATGEINQDPELDPRGQVGPGVEGQWEWGGKHRRAAGAGFSSHSQAETEADGMLVPLLQNLALPRTPAPKWVRVVLLCPET